MNFDDANARVREAKQRGYGRRRNDRHDVSLRMSTWKRLRAHATALGVRPTPLLEQWIEEAITGRCVCPACGQEIPKP